MDTLIGRREEGPQQEELRLADMDLTRRSDFPAAFDERATLISVAGHGRRLRAADARGTRTPVVHTAR